MLSLKHEIENENVNVNENENVNEDEPNHDISKYKLTVLRRKKFQNEQTLIKEKLNGSNLILYGSVRPYQNIHLDHQTNELTVDVEQLFTSFRMYKTTNKITYDANGKIKSTHYSYDCVTEEDISIKGICEYDYIRFNNRYGVNEFKLHEGMIPKDTKISMSVCLPTWNPKSHDDTYFVECEIQYCGNKRIMYEIVIDPT